MARGPTAMMSQSLTSALMPLANIVQRNEPRSHTSVPRFSLEYRSQINCWEYSSTVKLLHPPSTRTQPSSIKKNQGPFEVRLGFVRRLIDVCLRCAWPTFYTKIVVVPQNKWMLGWYRPTIISLSAATGLRPGARRQATMALAEVTCNGCLFPRVPLNHQIQSCSTSPFVTSKSPFRWDAVLGSSVQRDSLEFDQRIILWNEIRISLADRSDSCLEHVGIPWSIGWKSLGPFFN